jgi:hypothetical protein
MAGSCLDEFRTPGNNLAHWQRTAESLVSAAQILRTRSGDLREAHWGTLWPELMLWGFAVEDFLKALRLKNAIDSRNPDQLLFQNGALRARTHDLVRLAERAGFPLNPFQQNLLEQLTRAIRHGGRYPVPTNGELMSYYWYGQEGDDELDSIISALRDRLPANPSSYQKEKLEGPQ